MYVYEVISMNVGEQRVQFVRIMSQRESFD
jgi:hypothetical protein